MARLSRLGVLTLAISLTFGTTALAGSPGAGAVTALMMGGTSQPYPDKVTGYMDSTGRRYLDAVSACKIDTCNRLPTYIPNEASPLFTSGMAFGPSVAIGTGLLDTAVRTVLSQTDEQIVVFGNSQSATVAIEAKRALAADPGIDTDRLHFVVIGNPNRPNGGFMQRFFPNVVPIFEYQPTGTPISNTGIATTDIAFQYDIAADFPRYPGNLLAVLNVFAGLAVHGAYDDKVNPNGYTEEELRAEIDDLENRIIVGDTTYITIPTKVLPLAQALRGVGYTTGTSALLTPLADLLEPVLRVIVELGYDRKVSPDQQHSFGAFPKVNPLKVAGDIGNALGLGFRNMVTNIVARQRGSVTPQLAGPAVSGATATAPGTAPASSPEALTTPTSPSGARLADGKDTVKRAPASPVRKQRNRLSVIDRSAAGTFGDLDDDPAADDDTLDSDRIEPASGNGPEENDSAQGDDTDDAGTDGAADNPSPSSDPQDSGPSGDQ